MSKKAKETNQPTDETIQPNMKAVYSIIIIVIAFCLFVVTNFISGVTGDQTSTTTKIKSALKASPTTLVAAMPSLGPLLKTQAVETVLDEATGTAKFEIDSTQAKEIKNNQSVMLYNNDGKILYKLGKIKDTVTADSRKNGTISIPKDIEFKNLSKEMQVLTLKEYKTKRVPITALKQDEDNGPYVWVAEKPEKDIEISDKGNVVIDRHPELMNKATNLPVKKYFLHPKNNNGVLIDLGDRIPINTIVLLDPPTLEEGQSYPTLLTKIQAPALMPNYAESLIDGRKRQAERMAFLRQEIAKCGANKPATPTGITSLPEGEAPVVTPACAISANPAEGEAGGCGLSDAPADYLKMLGISGIDGNACGN